MIDLGDLKYKIGSLPLEINEVILAALQASDDWVCEELECGSEFLELMEKCVGEQRLVKQGEKQ